MFDRWSVVAAARNRTSSRRIGRPKTLNMRAKSGAWHTVGGYLNARLPGGTSP